MVNDNILNTEQKPHFFFQSKDATLAEQAKIEVYEFDLDIVEPDEDIYRELNVVSFRRSFFHLSRHFS